MKNLLFIAFLIVSAGLFANDPVTVNTAPDKAVVFLNGAQLFHSKTISLPSGTSDIIFEGIPQSIDPNSLQAGGKGDFAILDVQYRLYYPEPVYNQEWPDKIQKQIKLVQDSITELGFTIKQIQNQRSVLQLQQQMLYNNKLLVNGGGTDSLQLIMQSVEYYDKKLNEIYAALLSLERNELTTNNIIGAKQTRLYALQNYWAQENAKLGSKGPVPQVIVSVSSEFASSAKLEINYVTYNAGWYATYDIKATDIGQPVQLNYKANIWQNTGIDWKDVKLTCSTGNPLLGNTLPQLTTWYIGYYDYYYGRDYAPAESTTREGRAEDDANIAMGSVAKTLDEKKDAGSAANYTTHTQTIANVEFAIDLNYSIPSDGKGHLVSLESKTLPSAYNYLIVPKIEQSAFLIARITEWEGVNLLPGNANIYFNNSYVGKTYLDPLSLNDTLSLSLGRDRSIEVKRELVAEKSTDKILDTKNRKTLAYDITVRNGKPIAIDAIIMDQVPVSQDDDIKVEPVEIGKGVIDELTGFVTWREKLKTKETGKYSLEFDITYPKNQPLSLN